MRSQTTCPEGIDFWGSDQTGKYLQRGNRTVRLKSGRFSLTNSHVHTLSETIFTRITFIHVIQLIASGRSLVTPKVKDKPQRLAAKKIGIAMLANAKRIFLLEVSKT